MSGKPKPKKGREGQAFNAWLVDSSEGERSTTKRGEKTEI